MYSRHVLEGDTRPGAPISKHQKIKKTVSAIKPESKSRLNRLRLV